MTVRPYFSLDITPPDSIADARTVRPYFTLDIALPVHYTLNAIASEGILQSPRGDSVTLPTLGPSGIQLRLNC